MRWFVCAFVVYLFFLSGCAHPQFDDDLRGVPVTNNPNIVPSSKKGSVPF